MRKVKVTLGQLKPGSREWICLFFNNRCLMCGETSDALVLDLATPPGRVKRGVTGNKQPLCARCCLVKRGLWIDFRTVPAIWDDEGQLREWQHWHTERLFAGARVSDLRGESADPPPKPREKPWRPLSASPWTRICQTVGFACLGCGSIERPLTKDHIHAKSRGGAKKDWSNIQPLCRECNGKKGNATADWRDPEWINPKTGAWRCLEPDPDIREGSLAGAGQRA